MVHTHNGIKLSHDKQWNTAIHSNMDATTDYQTKWSKSNKDNTIWYLYVEFKIGHKWIYLWNKNKFMDIGNRMVAKCEGLGEA